MTGSGKALKVLLGGAVAVPLALSAAHAADPPARAMPAMPAADGDAAQHRRARFASTCRKSFTPTIATR